MKQTTLLKSWRNSQSECSVKKDAKQSSQLPNAVINLDSDEDPDDEILAQAMEESLKQYQVEQEATKQEPSTSRALLITSEGNNQTSCSPYFSVKTASDKHIADNHSTSILSKVNFNYKATSNDLNDIPGFDLEEGKTWIYSKNLPVRDYQYTITKECLFRNTLVCLPTGLGKTFIASIVIFNFYRWYPEGKVIFMAPTRPLVTQQMEACYKVTGIPEDKTVELTGSINPNIRRKLWREKRVFFLTPQVVVNDLESGACTAQSICCIVLDEAHKASGNYAYCQVIWQLTSRNHRQFRVLALTATPGSDLKTVQDVINNLLISHIELRNDKSVDIQRYSFARSIEKVVVALGEELSAVKTKLVRILESIISRLKMRNAIWPRQNVSNLSKFMLIKQREEFVQNGQGNLTHVELGFVQRDFSVGTTLFHALELLHQHGLRPMFLFLEGVLNGEKGSFVAKQELGKNQDFRDLWDELETRFRGNPDTSFNPMSTQAPFVGGHPKLDKLEDLVMNHFQEDQNSEGITQSKVIIFSQFRDSVLEIMHLLKQKRPLVRPMHFIGQSSTSKNSKGYTQKDQMRVMQEFREGAYNTLVSTCIGEEGLDIGEVDLIICFDTQKSPIRMIQRMGRTGRKRKGRVVMLLTEGKEEQNYSTSLSKKSSVDRAIIDNCHRIKFYPDNPHMVPIGVHPQPVILNIEVAAKIELSGKQKRNIRQSTLPGIVYSGKIPPSRTSCFQLTEEMLLHDQQNTFAINFQPSKIGHLVSLHKHTTESSLHRDVVSEYHLNHHLKSTCLNMQETALVDHSNVNLHMTSVLRLIEEHRRGKTNILYHAMGLRSVDLDASLSQATTQPNMLSPLRARQLTIIEELSSDEDFDSGPKRIKKKSPKDFDNETVDFDDTCSSPVFRVSQMPIVHHDANFVKDDLKSVLHFHNDNAYIIGGLDKVPKPPSILDTQDLISNLTKKDFSLSNFNLTTFFESLKSTPLPFCDPIDLSENSFHTCRDNSISDGVSSSYSPVNNSLLEKRRIKVHSSDQFDTQDMDVIHNIMDVVEHANISIKPSTSDVITHFKEADNLKRTTNSFKKITLFTDNSVKKNPSSVLPQMLSNISTDNFSNDLTSSKDVVYNRVMLSSTDSPYLINTPVKARVIESFSKRNCGTTVKTKMLSCFEFPHSSTTEVSSGLKTSFSDSIQLSDFDLAFKIVDAANTQKSTHVTVKSPELINSESPSVSPSYLSTLKSPQITSPTFNSNRRPFTNSAYSKSFQVCMDDADDEFFMNINCDNLMPQQSSSIVTPNFNESPTSKSNVSRRFLPSQNLSFDSIQVTFSEAQNILDESSMIIEPVWKYKNNKSLCVSSSNTGSKKACLSPNDGFDSDFVRTDSIKNSHNSKEKATELGDLLFDSNLSPENSPNLFKTPLSARVTKSINNQNRPANQPASSVKTKLLSCFELPETYDIGDPSWLQTSFSDSIQVDDLHLKVTNTDNIITSTQSNEYSPELFSSGAESTSPNLLTTTKPPQFTVLTSNSNKKSSNGSVYHNHFQDYMHDDDDDFLKEINCDALVLEQNVTSVASPFKKKDSSSKTGEKIKSGRDFSAIRSRLDSEEDISVIRPAKRQKINVLTDQISTSVASPIIKKGTSSKTNVKIASSQGFSVIQSRSDSDDQDISIIRPTKRRKVNILNDTLFTQNFQNSEIEDNNEFLSPQKTVNISHHSKHSKKKKPNSKKSSLKPFFLSQANFSPDEKGHSSEANSSLSGSYDSSFVDDDENSSEETNADMKHIYLQSVRSPLCGARSGAGFLIRPMKPIIDRACIFSQNPDFETQENTYMKDSFCVSSSADEPSPIRPMKSKKKRLKAKPARRKRLQCQETSSSQHNSSLEDFL